MLLYLHFKFSRHLRFNTQTNFGLVRVVKKWSVVFFKDETSLDDLETFLNNISTVCLTRVGSKKKILLRQTTGEHILVLNEHYKYFLHNRKLKGECSFWVLEVFTFSSMSDSYSEQHTTRLLVAAAWFHG